MAGLDDLFNQIPVADIATKLGADQGEVNQAIQTLVPTLLGTLQENVQADDIDSTELESTVVAEGQTDLLDGGVVVDQINETQGNQMVASLFGGNDTNQVASALSGAGAPGGDLIKRLLPMLAPIVLAYVGRQFSQRNAAGAGAMCWAASSAAVRPQAERRPATTRWAASWAACSAAARAVRSATSWAACCAAGADALPAARACRPPRIGACLTTPAPPLTPGT
jgi:hypothetical protein